MALAAGYAPARRGAPSAGGAIFGGPVAPGEKIWRGGMLAWNVNGQLVRLQTAGAIAFAGLASRDYDNSASGSASSPPYPEALKGVFALTVPNAGYAQINDPVYATDDNTFTLSDALTAAFARGAADTGNGTTGTITISNTARMGVYAGTILAGATTFSFVDPTGVALPNGTIGTAYSQNGVAFTLSNGGTAFVAGDTFTVSVEESAGAMQVGTLAGIENGQTYVKLLGS